MKIVLPLLLSLLVSCGPALPIDNPFGQPREAGNLPAGKLPEGTADRGDLRIVVLDVGQGDATLVIGPSGKSLLVDAGPRTEGTLTVLPALNSLGIDRLDWIVATHYDADHIGGMDEVLNEMVPALGLFDRGDFTDKSTPTFSGYIETAAPYRTEATPGLTFDLGAGAGAKVIVVNGRYSDGRVIHLNPDEENEACIGLLLRYGDFEYFTAGDLTGGGAPGGYETKDMETIAGEIIGDIDVLHVGHHGSLTSTNEKFLEEIKPEAAVISVGKDNDYGHPTETVLKRLEKAGAAVYRTDEMGTLEITSDGSGFEIQPVALGDT